MRQLHRRIYTVKKHIYCTFEPKAASVKKLFRRQAFKDMERRPSEAYYIDFSGDWITPYA